MLGGPTLTHRISLLQETFVCAGVALHSISSPCGEQAPNLSLAVDIEHGVCAWGAKTSPGLFRALPLCQSRAWYVDALLLTCERFLMPMTKQMESRMLDLPVPFSPVMALNVGSKLDSETRCA